MEEVHQQVYAKTVGPTPEFKAYINIRSRTFRLGIRIWASKETPGLA